MREGQSHILIHQIVGSNQKWFSAMALLLCCVTNSVFRKAKAGSVRVVKARFAVKMSFGSEMSQANSHSIVNSLVGIHVKHL